VRRHLRARLTELNTKVVDSLILVLAVNFLERLVGSERPLDLLWRGLATASVGALLVAFGVAKNR
jgi:uncharacterized membrane protein YqhA